MVTQAKPDTLHTAMAAAFGEIEAVTKSALGQVGQQKYKYADIGSVIDAIKPALVNHGLFFTQHPQPSERGVTVETILHHASGESMSMGVLFVPANKADAQGYGSALTYARRYALVTAFGVPTEDDDRSAATRKADIQLIDDGQWSELLQLCEATSADMKAFCTAYKIGSLRDLPATDFARAKAQLNKKLTKLRETADA